MIPCPVQADMAHSAQADYKTVQHTMEVALAEVNDPKARDVAIAALELVQVWIVRYEDQRLRADRAESENARLEEIIRKAKESGVHI